MSAADLSDGDLAERIRTAHRRKEVTRLEGLLEIAEVRREPLCELRQAARAGAVYLDGFRKECLKILKGK